MVPKRHVHRLVGPDGIGELRVGHELLPNGSLLRRFRTRQFAVVYLATGEALLTDAAGRRWPAAAGDLIHRYPDRIHDLGTSPGTTIYWAAMPAAAYDLARMAGLPGLGQPVLRIGLDPPFLTRWQALIGEVQRAPHLRLMTAMTRVQQLIVDLHERSLLVSHRRTAEVERACLMLAGDLAGRLPLPEVARRVGMGYAAFRAAFHAVVGISARCYRLRRRMERARDLLRGSDRSLAEIAADLGYADVYAFSTQFRAEVGTPPGRFRRLERGDPAPGG